MWNSCKARCVWRTGAFSKYTQRFSATGQAASLRLLGNTYKCIGWGLGIYIAWHVCGTPPSTVLSHITMVKTKGPIENTLKIAQAMHKVNFIERWMPAVGFCLPSGIDHADMKMLLLHFYSMPQESSPVSQLLLQRRTSSRNPLEIYLWFVPRLAPLHR